VVGGMTGIRVWETVTDRVFDQADEVVLVDLPPDELLAAAQGRQGLPAGSGRTRDSKFLPQGQPDRLRELALRRTADRVDDEMQSYQQRDGGIPPPLREALLVCVGPGPEPMRWCAPPAGWPANWMGMARSVRGNAGAATPAGSPPPGDPRTPSNWPRISGAQTATQGRRRYRVPAIVEYARNTVWAGWWSGAAGRAVGGWLSTPLAERLARLAPDLDLLALARTDVPRRLARPKP
jgi:two-component system sensor histidine kinase KdpD